LGKPIGKTTATDTHAGVSSAGVGATLDGRLLDLYGITTVPGHFDPKAQDGGGFIGQAATPILNLPMLGVYGIRETTRGWQTDLADFFTGASIAFTAAIGGKTLGMAIGASIGGVTGVVTGSIAGSAIGVLGLAIGTGVASELAGPDGLSDWYDYGAIAGALTATVGRYVTTSFPDIGGVDNMTIDPGFGGEAAGANARFEMGRSIGEAWDWLEDNIFLPTGVFGIP